METLEHSLISLHNALIDSRNGYQEAAKQADQQPMIDFFRSMIDMRTGHITQLEQALVARGSPVDASGTLMSTVHTTVIDIRSMITGLNQASLASFASGEETILKSYDAAVGYSADDAALAQLLRQQRSAVVAKVELMYQAAKAA